MREIKDGIRALKKVEALLLLAFDLFAGLWGLASLSCSSMGPAKRLLQGFY